MCPHRSMVHQRFGGLRFAGGAWLGMRRSNTEPIVRLVVESVDAEWVSHVVNTLQNIYLP